ncbi:MAG: hypothetical protein WCD02_10440 [Terriglobales bacterium]
MSDELQDSLGAAVVRQRFERRIEQITAAKELGIGLVSDELHEHAQDGKKKGD